VRVVRPDLEAADGRRRRLDVGGALSVTGASLVFVGAIVEAPSAGWASLQTIGSFVATALLLTVFVVVERSVEQPLVRFGILRSAVLVRANAGAMLLFGCATGLNFITTLYLQDLLGWGPLKTGLYFMFSGLATAAVGPWAGALITRIGSTPIILAGAVATLASSAVFLDIGVSSNSEVIVASRLLAGLGFGLAYPALNIQALNRVHDDEQGLASGLVGSSFQIGGAIVLAITTATLLAHTPAQASAAQTLHGFHTAVWVTAVTAALFVLLAFAGLLSRWRSASHDSAEIDAPQADTIETEQPLEQAA
jgi:hypothetical protein